MTARFDLDLPDLRRFRPEVDEPEDFDAFWRTTLAASRALVSPPVLEPVRSTLSSFDVLDLTFTGSGGDPVRGWVVKPVGAEGPLPTVVEFVGYGGGRGLPHEHLQWPASGYAHVLMDTRGQGSAWGTGGATADPHGSAPATPGFMTRGIGDPDGYYYRRVLTDAVLLVEAVRSLPFVDPARTAVTGTSQGGGIAIAVAGLVDGLVAAMPDVPFLCHFRRAVGMTDAGPYAELVQYLAVHRDLVAQTFRTLSYFDGVSFAARATAPALFSTALLDPICPPSTVFAAANRWGGEAAVEVYEFNQHEGGQGLHWQRQASWLGDLLAG